MFDQFDTIAGSEAGAALHLESPATGSYAYASKDGKPDESLPMLIDLLGPDADEYRAKTRKRAARVIKQRAGKMDLKKMTEDQVEAFVLDGEKSTLMDAVDATTGWTNLSIDGKAVKYSHDNAVKLYTRYPEILRQVTAFIKEAANFLQKA
jgi:hypothetical protein